jgi:hypothetical protein
MHTTIKTYQNDPNFLTHDLWSKTNLGMQHIHLELLWILSYVFTKKIRHILRINIVDNYKIVINSLEVHFGIKRYHAEAWHNNLFIFSYKNHLDKFCIKTKQFI